jgi:hypothetical protein
VNEQALILCHPGRQRVLNLALDARTLPEIEAATQELRTWLREHPEDVGMPEAFEGLSLLRDIAEEQEAERVIYTEQAV